MSAARESRMQLVAAGLTLAVLWALATTVGPFSDTTVNDLYVYRTYAELLTAGQLPYLDFAFEYPPLAALPLGLAGLPGSAEQTYAVSFAVLMAGCALGGQQLAARLAGATDSLACVPAGGGVSGGVVVAWLLALSPIIIGASLRTHFDALPIAIALGALLALARGRTNVGFLLLGLGTMTKLFPGLLAVVAIAWLVARGDRVAAARGGAIFVAVLLAISLPFAGSGYVDSFRFHLERPVQIESSAASVLFALGGSEVTGTKLRPDRFKSNGLDGGHADAVELAFALALVLVLAAIVALAARHSAPRHMVLCGFAALLAFVTLGKVFSPQYVIWLAPFTALAWVWRERAVALLVGAAIVLTHVEFPSRYFDLINERHGVIWIVSARNGLLAAALIVLVARLLQAPAAEPCRESRRVGSLPR
ncbi:MAG: glycosyltransferase 87 family protein [Solirubrobacteraceae bacterium]